MAQIFSRSADMWFRLALLAIIGGALLLCLLGMLLVRSDYVTGVNWHVPQPVPFSHRHHAGELQIDCRYCHTTVETAASAGFPPTHTCMSCHSQVWTEADMLAPVRQSLLEDRPLRWNRVSKLPDYVYFRHDAHVRAGVGCDQCHGRVDRMALTRQAESFQMRWCLECHRDPAPHLRPRRFVTDLAWHAPADRRAQGEKLLEEYHVNTIHLDNCYLCHR